MKNRWKKEFVFWLKCCPPVFWPQFWFHRAFMCSFDRHRFTIMYVTDGSIAIWCLWCSAEREPTTEEEAGHPNLHLNPKQLARLEEINRLFPRRGSREVT